MQKLIKWYLNVSYDIEVKKLSSQDIIDFYLYIFLILASLIVAVLSDYKGDMIGMYGCLLLMWIYVAIFKIVVYNIINQNK